MHRMLDLKLLQTIITRTSQYRDANEIFMEGRDYTCANPEAIFHGAPRTIQECEQRFFAGYTGITMKPSECEPSECCLQEAFQDVKLCNEIETQLGGEYLGCLLIDPNAPYSCDCPKVGKQFHKLLNVAFKNSTFWNTDPISPLYRKALLSLMNAIKVDIKVAGTFNVSPGDVILIDDPVNPVYQTNMGKLNGKWLVLSIKHHIFKDRHHEMTLSLSAFGRAVSGGAFDNVTYSNIDSLERIQR